ncbi:MAG TPA: DUF4395 family protein [Armatimonadota bacterium]
MIGYEPVSVSRNGFRFCRWSVTVMVWIGVIWRVEAFILAAALIMAASAILTIRNAPMIWLWTQTVDRAIPSPSEMLDVGGMRLAQSVATFALGVPWLVLNYGPASASESMWRILVFVAGFKTLGALGYCPVSRMFTCLISGGNCCTWLKGRKAA